jgi:hypothetical protein
MLRLDLPELGGGVERVGRPATVELRCEGLAERSRGAVEVARRQRGVVRRGDDLRVVRERSGRRVGLVREHVESGAGEASLVERVEERGLVDQRRSSWFVARGQDHRVGRHKRFVDPVGAHDLDVGHGRQGAAADVSPHAD